MTSFIERSLIAKFNAPSLKIAWQKGFSSAEDAEEYLASLNFCTPREQLVSAMGGKQTALHFVICTEEDTEWREFQVSRRCRFEAKSVKQVRQPPFDDRLMQRTRLLPERQRDALQGLLKLRQQQPNVSPFAAQLEIEVAFESEFSTEQFDLPYFLSDCWSWQETLLRKSLRSNRV